MKTSRRIKRMVLCAMFSALGTVLLWFGGLLGDLDLTVAAAASLIVVIASIEMGNRNAFLVYLVTSALSLILFPSYYITALYALFVGFYPIAKALFEKLPKLLSLVCKLVLMNGMLILLCLIGRGLYGIEEDTVFWVLLILANVAFLIFDYAMTLLITLYYQKFRKIFGIQKMLR